MKFQHGKTGAHLFGSEKLTVIQKICTGFPRKKLSIKKTSSFLIQAIDAKMNKIIAELFSGILTLIHLAFIYILFLIGTEKRPEVIKYVPDFFLQSESRAGIIIALSIAYILLMGLISTFVSINTYLSEIKEILEKNNN